METGERIAQLESELKVLKSEVQAVLLDLRDRYLESENPFNTPALTATTQHTVIDRQSSSGESRPKAESESNRGDNEVGGEGGADTSGDGTSVRSQKAPEEVTEARKADASMRSSIQRLVACRAASSLVTIGGLANWADESVMKLGRQRTETILDVCEMLGWLTPELKGILAKLVNLDADGRPDAVPVAEYLDSLVKVTTLLGKDNQAEQAMLAVLGGGNSHR